MARDYATDGRDRKAWLCCAFFATHLHVDIVHRGRKPTDSASRRMPFAQQVRPQSSFHLNVKSSRVKIAWDSFAFAASWTLLLCLTTMLLLIPGGPVAEARSRVKLQVFLDTDWFLECLCILLPSSSLSDPSVLACLARPGLQVDFELDTSLRCCVTSLGLRCVAYSPDPRWRWRRLHSLLIFTSTPHSDDTVVPHSDRSTSFYIDLVRPVTVSSTK
ncbi:hypothetical protein C8R45DRAFT_1107194 [Mycena sanguinolenta]|nr:hypothetical protein C8R45DRAFT_1107194 [Mycena sanguinolenta]